VSNFHVTLTECSVQKKDSEHLLSSLNLKMECVKRVST
jgi:hypothetical protein